MTNLVLCEFFPWNSITFLECSIGFNPVKFQTIFDKELCNGVGSYFPPSCQFFSSADFQTGMKLQLWIPTKSQVKICLWVLNTVRHLGEGGMSSDHYPLPAWNLSEKETASAKHKKMFERKPDKEETRSPSSEVAFLMMLFQGKLGKVWLKKCRWCHGFYRD